MRLILPMIAYLFLILTSCSTEPIFDDHDIILRVDAEVTETWITLKVNNREKNATYIVKRDSTIIFNSKLTKSDTLLHDENLEPATTYNFSVYAQKSGEKSKTIFASSTTLDTTSHDFSWEVIKVSERLDVNLWDVAIIDPNNIYVVGFIPNENEMEEDYNVVHWDGEHWELERINIHGYPYEINSIYGISNNNIWISNGNYGHWDGYNWSFGNNVIPYQKIWGENNNVWFVGTDGKIINYEGTNWTNEESGTTVDLRDIYGYYDEKTGERIVYACGFNFNQDEAVVLTKENDEEWQVLDNGQNGIFSAQAYPDFASLWLNNPNTLFIASYSDVLKIRKRKTNKYVVQKILAGMYGIYRLRGNDINDLFVAGDNTDLRHYNGSGWHLYSSLSSGTVKGLDFKNDIIVAVSSGTILIGKRN